MVMENSEPMPVFPNYSNKGYKRWEWKGVIDNKIVEYKCSYCGNLEKFDRNKFAFGICGNCGNISIVPKLLFKTDIEAIKRREEEDKFKKRMI